MAQVEAPSSALIQTDRARCLCACRFQHSQTADGGARSIEYCDLRRLARANSVDERRHLLGVAFVGEPFGAGSPDAARDGELLEVLGHCADTLREHFDT